MRDHGDVSERLFYSVNGPASGLQEQLLAAEWLIVAAAGACKTLV